MLIAVVLGYQKINILPCHVCFRVTEHPLGSRVEGFNQPALIDGHDGIDDVVQQGAEVFFTFPQAFLGLEAIRNVLNL